MMAAVRTPGDHQAWRLGFGRRSVKTAARSGERRAWATSDWTGAIHARQADIDPALPTPPRRPRTPRYGKRRDLVQCRRCNPLASPGKRVAVKGLTAMRKKRDDIIVRAGSPFHAEPPSVLASGDTGRSDIARRAGCTASADLPPPMPHHPVAAIGDRRGPSRAALQPATMAEECAPLTSNQNADHEPGLRRC